MPQVSDPVPAPLAALLRAAVGEHRHSEGRREHPSTIEAGRPGGVRARFTSPWAGAPGRARAVPLDHALRCNVVARLLDRLARGGELACEPLLWLTRPASQEDPDEDRAWLAAVLAAAAERELDPWWVVVTRDGWHDPRSGAAGRW